MKTSTLKKIICICFTKFQTIRRKYSFGRRIARNETNIIIQRNEQAIKVSIKGQQTMPLSNVTKAIKELGL